MELAEYGGGNRCNFLLIPEDNRGNGWSGVAEALWATVADGRFSNNIGTNQTRSMVPQASTHDHSYKETLTLPPAACKGGDGGGRVSRSEQGAGKEDATPYHDSGVLEMNPRIIDQVQTLGGKGREAVGLQTATH